MEGNEKITGRGARSAPKDPYSRFSYAREEEEGLDPLEEEEYSDPKTRFLPVHPKKLVQRVKSPDLGNSYSLNPYQGCEHGCIYCYARNTHPYWGYSAGLDFEREVLVKEDAPSMLAKEMRSPKWERLPLMLSGNTDCYQPVEKEKGITRGVLEQLLAFGQPVSIVTKNRLIRRDLDILHEMAVKGLVHVNLSLTTLDEGLRRVLEPRTASGKLRLRTMKELSEAGVPVRALIAPVIPSLNGSEIPELVRGAAAHGALDVSYAMLRLNGQLPGIFEEWLDVHYPDRKEKVLHQVADTHGGQLNDSRYGTRLRGEGAIAASVRDLFRIAKRKHFQGKELPPFRFDLFDNGHGKQMELFPQK